MGVLHGMGKPSILLFPICYKVFKGRSNKLRKYYAWTSKLILIRTQTQEAILIYVIKKGWVPNTRAVTVNITVRI